MRFARGRFALMGVVIALISILVVLLSGLSSGLVNDGVSGLKAMPVTAFAFNEGTLKDNAFNRSIVDDEQLEAWRDASGVDAAEPIGVSIVNGTTDADHQVDLTLFGVAPDGFLAPAVASGEALAADPAGIVVSAPLQEEGVELGTVIRLDRIDLELKVIGFTEGQSTFGHVDIAYLPIETWRLIASNEATPGPPTRAAVEALDYPYSSAIAIKSDGGADLDFAAIDETAGTTSMSLTESFKASPGYEAETLTLSMIQIFLYVICALVVGAFFTVWTIQRTTDIAVLRAVGASSLYLLRDSLGQAALLLIGFTALGILGGVAMAAAMPSAMPFELELAPILFASIVTVLAGIVGAAIAVLRISGIEPLQALGGGRR